MELIARTGPQGERVERISIERRSGDRFRIAIGERVHEVEARSLGPFVRSLLVDGESHETALFRVGDGAASVWSVGWRGETTRVELVDPLTHLSIEARGDAAKSGRQVITAYMPGRVVSVAVAEGAEVEAGQPLVVLEAMKMQNELQADRAGKVAKIHVVPGQAVEGGDPLIELV